MLRHPLLFELRGAISCTELIYLDNLQYTVHIQLYTLAMPDSSTMTKSSAWAVLVRCVPPQNSIE